MKNALRFFLPATRGACKVLGMFSYFEKQVSGMAFTHSKAEHARRAAAGHLETTLYAYLDGREKAYAVKWALREVRAVFGAGATMAAGLVEQAMRCDPDDEATRLALVTKALDLLGRARSADHLPI